jgi:hypothetical protein
LPVGAEGGAERRPIAASRAAGIDANQRRGLVYEVADENVGNAVRVIGRQVGSGAVKQDFMTIGADA